MFYYWSKVLFLLFYGKQLFQQYLINVWIFYDQKKYNWIQFHQKNFYADLYNRLADALIQGDTKLLNSINLEK